MVYKEFIVPLEFNHPFSEDELVTVVRKEDLEWLREKLEDLKKDNKNLENHLKIFKH